MLSRRLTIALLLTLVVYVGLGFLFAWRTPDWQAPDEPAHYNYIAQVTGGNLLPVIQPGDWDSQYLDQLKASGFDPAQLDRLETIRYENHQPPLYYWLAAPVYSLTDGSLLALRMVSVILGAGTVTLAFFIARLTLPQQPAVAVGTAALVAFTPQHLSILSSVNNDALAGLIVAAILLACLRILRGNDTSPLLLGVLVGLGFITKTTTYFMAGVALLTLFIQWRLNKGALWRQIVPFGMSAALFAVLYWGRNISVYGFPDFLGLRAHDAVVVGQRRTVTLMEQTGTLGYLEQAVMTVFNSFWGQFGWMAAPMFNLFSPSDNVIYPALLAFVIVALVGWLLWVFSPQHRVRVPVMPGSVRLWLLHGLVIVLTFAMLVYYNTEFVQFQGRYLFPALIPIALVLVFGLYLFLRRFVSKPIARGVLLATLTLFPLLDVYLIWRVIPGALS